MTSENSLGTDGREPLTLGQHVTPPPPPRSVSRSGPPDGRANFPPAQIPAGCLADDMENGQCAEWMKRSARDWFRELLLNV